MTTNKQIEEQIKEWKYWSDEFLDNAQRALESDLGYNGTDVNGFVWVPIYEGTEKENRVKLPVVPSGLKLAIISYGNQRQLIKQTQKDTLDKVQEIIKQEKLKHFPFDDEEVVISLQDKLTQLENETTN